MGQRGCWGELGGVEGGKIVAGMFCLKEESIFNLKKEKRKIFINTHTQPNLNDPVAEMVMRRGAPVTLTREVTRPVLGMEGKSLSSQTRNKCSTPESAEKTS